MMKRILATRGAGALMLTAAGCMGVVGCGGGSSDHPATGDDSGFDGGSESDGGTVADDGGQVSSDDSGTGMTPPVDSGADAMTSVADSGPDAGLDAGHAGDASDASGPQPEATFAATAIDLGAGDCAGAAVTKSLTIQNTGSAALTVTAAVSGAAFAVSPSTLSIPAGSSSAFVVSATVPQTSTAGAALSGSLTVTTNDKAHASTAVQLSVTPQGATLAWAPGSATTADFGTAPLNKADTAVAVTLKNVGNASTTVTLAASTDTQFSVTPTSGTLAAGATLPLTANFTPTSTTLSQPASAISTTGAICGTSVAQLSFSGQGGVGNVTGYPTTPVDFGFSPCGVETPPPAQTFTLTNSGGIAVHVTLATLSGASGFTTNAGGLTIPANGSAVVTVGAPVIPFPSAVPGNYTSSLVLTTDIANDTPHQISLTEEAQGAVLAWDTLSTDNFGTFGNVPAGTNANQGFNVVNSGNAPSTVTLTSASPFSTGTSTFSLGVGSQGDTATFAPTTFGAAQGTLSISGTGLCQPVPAALNLSGDGQEGGISLSTQSIAFSASCGSSATPASFTISNPGNQPMTWTAALNLGVNSPYTFSPPSGTINPGDPPATVTVAPNAIPPFPVNTSPHAFADALVVTTNIAGDQPHSVSLSETPLGDILSLQPTALSFGQVPVNSTSPAQTFVVVNAANTGSPTASVVLTSSNGSQFPLAVVSVTAPAGGGTSSPVGLTFVPGSNPGSYSSNIGIATTDALCAPLPSPALAASGVGTLAHVVINVAQLNFGAVNCGTTANAQQIILTNTGNQNYSVTSATLTAGTAYTYAMSPANGVVQANEGNQLVITVTPKAIPATVADPAHSGGIFSDQFTITTDAQGDSPHIIPLNEQAQGAVVDNNLATTSWNFGTVNFGSTSTFNLSLHNAGNAPVQIALTGLTQSVFGLAPNPTVQTVAPGVQPITGTFAPNAPTGSWADQGVVNVTPTAGNVFCEPLPTSWSNATISLQGAASNNPTITLAGSLSFPATSCGGIVPAGQSITIQNSATNAVSFSAQFDYGTNYSITTASSGSVPANGTATVGVAPLASSTTPSATLEPGSTTFDDRLQLTVGSTIYYIPISMTLNGAVLSLQNAYTYEAVNQSGNHWGDSIFLQNSGNVSTTATPTFVGSVTPGDWATTPMTQTIPANSGNNGGVAFQLVYNGTHSCNQNPTFENGVIGFTGTNLCQPFIGTGSLIGCTEN
jgi:hypothetical protein